MASHNGELYIRQQIESILSQLEENDELIISDDGSTDSTISIIESFADHRIRLLHYIKREKKIYHYSQLHYKVTANFENALLHARGDYIFLSDQDDIWMSNKVAVMLSLLYKFKFVRSNNAVIDAKGNVVIEKEYNYNPLKISRMWRFPFRGCCCAFRREVLEKALPFPKDCMMHDAWIGLVAFAMCRPIYFFNQSLILYRRYDKNVTSEKGKSSNEYWYRIWYRLKAVLQLLKRFSSHKLGCLWS